MILILPFGRKLNILKTNFNNPSNVCAIPARAEPIAAKSALTRPRMVLRIDWRKAMMELKVAMMALKMEETRFVRDSTREGMAALVFDSDSS